MQIQRLVDLEDYEFDTLLVTYNHKNRLSIELGKVSEIFESLQADGLVGGSKVYGLRGKDFSYQGQPYYNLIFIGIPEKATPRRFQLQFGQAMKEAKRFHGNDSASFKKEEQYTRMMAKAVTTARDLVNEPANVMTPAALAAKAKEICEKNNIKCTILEKQDCEALGMNSYLAVARGSKQSAKFIVMEYNGRVTDDEKIALIGKGLCFDSGGYNLKPGNAMKGMHGDMGGAAAVIAAMGAIAEAKLGINVTAVIPACENMISGKAMKPGDIVKSMNGKYIEVVNTDAEGRMALIDAITYAIRECGATTLIDVATLTGACVVALGDRYTGAFSNSDELMSKIVQASILAGENIWRLPMGDEEYDNLNASTVADIANCGKKCGATAAARFLGEFVEKKPWVHLDIAGTSESDEDTEIYSKGGTGAATMLLYEVVKLMEKPYKSY